MGQLSVDPRFPPVWGMGKLKNEFSLGLPQGAWVCERYVGYP